MTKRDINIWEVMRETQLSEGIDEFDLPIISQKGRNKKEELSDQNQEEN